MRWASVPEGWASRGQSYGRNATGLHSRCRGGCNAECAITMALRLLWILILRTIRPARTTRALLADAVVLREEAASACPLKLFVANAFIFSREKEDLLW
jgi:hypothetical protein